MVICAVVASDPQTSSDVVIIHPNREKAVVQSTRAVVILLMLVTVALLLIITIGGGSVLQSASIIVQVAYAIVFLVLAFYAVRWNRGVLPVGSSLSVLLAIFALVAAPGWFDRDKAGFAHPALSSGVLGIITLLLIPVQVLLITFAMRGFNQGWNVELERPNPSSGDYGDLARGAA